jgi:4,5-DOPA dioxygenase extradiol
MFPTLFVSHGSPMIATMKHGVRNFLKELPKKFEKPKYIIIVSAHWVSNDLRILSTKNPKIIYDFYGFSKELYDIKYAIKNDANRVEEVVNVLEKSGLHVGQDFEREGYDHGVWVPLSLMYGDADIPIVQLSLPVNKSSEELVKIGEALSELREDALIIGSGNITHNLGDSVMREVDAPIKEYARVFRNQVVKKVQIGDVNLLNNTSYLKENHPSLEHFLPIFIAMGASKSRVGKAMLDAYMYGNQSMDMIIYKD